ncbi:MAG: ABC transporter ATP-binding protein [Clostridia bacterium]|nr:ABC transporter ATP-binding protein [Clostridia bacterium]
MDYILECKELSKYFSGNKNIGVVKALDNINLGLEKGKIIGLLGPNGSGKTTLIKLAAGLLKQNSGEILIDGAAPGEITKSYVSYLPERNFLSNAMKVYETLDLFESFYPDFDRSRAEEMLAKLNIHPSQKYKSLSKGTKEKVQLVLVMARRAKLYLLDEPIGGVDPATRDYILNTIVSNYAEDATVLISTHLISDVENVLDEFIFLKQGKVVLHSSSDEIRSEYGKSVDEYFREVFRC